MSSKEGGIHCNCWSVSASVYVEVKWQPKTIYSVTTLLVFAATVSSGKSLMETTQTEYAEV